MIRIKNLESGSIKMFHCGGEFPRYFQDCERNDLKIKRLFEDTQKGIIKGFYLIDKKNFRAYHRSPKKDGFIQLSSGFYKNGELFPCYDVQMKNFEDLTREGYNSGFYDIIV
jgi:hypothetical protein